MADQRERTNSTSRETTASPESINELIFLEREKDWEAESAKELLVDVNAATCSTKTPIFKSPFIRSKSPGANEVPLERFQAEPRSIIKETNSTIVTQPFRTFSNMPSPISLIAQPNQPQSLFLQALNKLNENPLSLKLLNQALRLRGEPSGTTQSSDKNLDLSPPESLTSAPPSYSFVLRQMAARRPRLMGTFIPSPSFVQHTPPPNYAAAFDIYVEPSMPPPPTRVYSFGFTSMPAVCPECGFTGMTSTTAKVTLCTHLCAVFLCLFCCWICAPLPYVLKSCKDVYHYCRNCRSLLGMYCPTNPDNSRRLPAEPARQYLTSRSS